jgi:thiol:disulfide interchange protein
MKRIPWLAALAVAALTATTFAAPTEGWLTDHDKALAKARAEHKNVFVEFTGSDWCPPCIFMKKNVFSKKEFIDPASKNFVLLEIDLPAPGSGEITDETAKLVEKYKMAGAPLPMAILLAPDGKEFTRFIPSDFPTVEAILQHLNEALENKDLD